MVRSVAWKNVWRNRKRSLVVIVAVLLGTTAGVFTSGLMNGWVEQRIRAAIFTEVSHLKLHNPEFLNNEEVGNTLPHAETVVQYLKKNPAVKAFSRRIKLMAMASTARGNTALMLNGINVSEEKLVSELHTQLIPGAGTYFESAGTFPIVIGDKVAEQLRIKSYRLSRDCLDSLQVSAVPEKTVSKLKSIADVRFNTKKLFEKKLTHLLSRKEVARYGPVFFKASVHYRLRSKIVFTFADKNGELINQAFRVCGVFKTSNTLFDQLNAYVLKSDLEPIAGLKPDEFHEIATILQKDSDPKVVQRDVRAHFSDISALTWKELATDAGMISDYMTLYYYIIMGFILFALAFGIVNTMLMAVMERTKELGMLMAIGMNRKRVFSMIVLETVFLTMVGAIVGMGLGWLIIIVTGRTGINFSSVAEGFESFGWSAVVYPSIGASFFFGVTLMVVATGVLASLAPARRALNLNPVDALRSDN